MSETSTSPDPAAELASRYYAHLLEQGGKALGTGPIVHVEGMVGGSVLWPEEHATLRGVIVEPSTPFVERTPDPAGVAAAQVERLASLGFSPEMQQRGIWYLRGVAWANTGERWLYVPAIGVTLTHYDGTNWHTVDSEPGRGWQEPVAGLDDRKREAIVRIARETDFVRDVALGLGDEPFTRIRLGRALLALAENSGDERAVPSIRILLNPRADYPDTTMLDYLPPTLSKIDTLVHDLRRRAEDPGASIEALTSYPPYEPIDLA